MNTLSPADTKVIDAPISSLHIPQLDGIRGIAILLVVIFHYFAKSIDPHANLLTEYAAKLADLTWSGVDLFFVLSGFLIGGILLDHRKAPNYFQSFYARRIARIFPLYFAYLVAFLIVGTIMLVFWASPPMIALFGSPFSPLAYITYTQNIQMAMENRWGPAWLSVTWSLAVEEQFYLLLPFIIRLVKPRWIPRLLVTLILLSPVWRIVQWLASNVIFANYVLLFARMDALFFGVLCAYLMRRSFTKNLIQTHRRALYTLMFILAFSLAFLPTHLAPEDHSVEMNTYGYSLLALLYACFLLIAITEQRGLVSKLTQNPLLRQLGILAYGIYLFHDPVNRLAHAMLLNQTPHLQTVADILVTLLSFTITLALAYFSWHTFEKKFVARGHAIQYKK
ncbi:MAG: acyltransferase [Chloroflexi bacterium]|nr:acyltransferase [Chloroflexota bacterium]